MPVTTQLQIVDHIKSIANSHKMVSDVRYGFLTDLDDLPDFDPPVVYIIPQPVSIPRDGILQFQFNLVCFDLLLPDKSNFDDVISDCTGILIDIYSRLLYYTDNGSGFWAVQTGTSFTPFQERFKDYSAGASMTINIQAFQENCTEGLPFN